MIVLIIMVVIRILIIYIYVYIYICVYTYYVIYHGDLYVIVRFSIQWISVFGKRCAWLQSIAMTSRVILVWDLGVPGFPVSVCDRPWDSRDGCLKMWNLKMSYNPILEKIMFPTFDGHFKVFPVWAKAGTCRESSNLENKFSREQVPVLWLSLVSGFSSFTFAVMSWGATRTYPIDGCQTVSLDSKTLDSFCDFPFHTNYNMFWNVFRVVVKREPITITLNFFQQPLVFVCNSIVCWLYIYIQWGAIVPKPICHPAGGLIFGTAESPPSNLLRSTMLG